MVEKGDAYVVLWKIEHGWDGFARIRNNKNLAKGLERRQQATGTRH